MKLNLYFLYRKYKLSYFVKIKIQGDFNLWKNATKIKYMMNILKN